MPHRSEKVSGARGETAKVTPLAVTDPKLEALVREMRWYDDYLTRRGSEVRCAVCLADSGQLVGMVSLTRIDYLRIYGGNATQRPAPRP